MSAASLVCPYWGVLAWVCRKVTSPFGHELLWHKPACFKGDTMVHRSPPPPPHRQLSLAWHDVLHLVCASHAVLCCAPFR
jgi:hypothetical protein